MHSSSGTFAEAASSTTSSAHSAAATQQVHAASGGMVEPATAAASAAASSSSSSSSSSAAPSSSLRSSRVRSPPSLHEVRVSSGRSSRYFVDIALRLLLRHEVISVVGLGSSIQLAIEVAQALVALGFARPIKIATSSVHAGGAVDRTPKPQFRMDLARTRMPVEDRTAWTTREIMIAEAAERERAPPTSDQTDE